MAISKDQEIKRRQAYNNAIAVACAEGQQNNNEYIAKQFLRHVELSALFVKANPEQLVALLDCPKMIQLIRQIDAEL